MQEHKSRAMSKFVTTCTSPLTLVLAFLIGITIEA